MRVYIITSLLVIIGFAGQAQSDFIGYGFRAGLSLSRIDGPSEVDAFGNELEQNKFSSGFHIGMSLNFKFTDIMGLRTELTYSQRGTEYTFEGPSQYLIGRNSLQPVNLLGTRRQTLNLSNSYIDIPLLAYFKVGYFEISGGLNTGLLIGSAAGGSIEFTGTSPLGNPVLPFEINLNHNYKSDDAGFASEAMKDVNVDGRNSQIPEFVGAYYDFPTRDKDLYKTLDFGLAIGLAYFLNDGLYISTRYIHGLGDMDRNEYDLSLASFTPAGVPIARADINKSKSLQFSVGFSF